MVVSLKNPTGQEDPQVPVAVSLYCPAGQEPDVGAAVAVGVAVGAPVEGDEVGELAGADVDAFEGTEVGALVGAFEGTGVGGVVGVEVGGLVGALEGADVGELVGAKVIDAQIGEMS